MAGYLWRPGYRPLYRLWLINTGISVVAKIPLTCQPWKLWYMHLSKEDLVIGKICINGGLKSHARHQIQKISSHQILNLHYGMTCTRQIWKISSSLSILILDHIAMLWNFTQVCISWLCGILEFTAGGRVGHCVSNSCVCLVYVKSATNRPSFKWGSQQKINSCIHRPVKHQLWHETYSPKVS